MHKQAKTKAYMAKFPALFSIRREGTDDDGYVKGNQFAFSFVPFSLLSYITVIETKCTFLIK